MQLLAIVTVSCNLIHTSEWDLTNAQNLIVTLHLTIVNSFLVIVTINHNVTISYNLDFILSNIKSYGEILRISLKRDEVILRYAVKLLETKSQL